MDLFPRLKLPEKLQEFPTFTVSSFTPTYICPDLLRYEQLGEADGWRGHLVRAFFRFLKLISGI